VFPSHGESSSSSSYDRQPAEFIASLKKPRKVVILVMAGKPVDLTIELLAQYMEVRRVVVTSHHLEAVLLLLPLHMLHYHHLIPLTTTSLVSDVDDDDGGGNRRVTSSSMVGMSGTPTLSAVLKGSNPRALCSWAWVSQVR